MVTTVGTKEVKSRLSEYLGRASSGQERIVVEEHGQPLAALVSIDDLRRLEQLDQVDHQAPSAHDRDSDPVKQARYRRAMEEAGLVVQWPTGEPVPREMYKPIEIGEPPLSEQIIADRR